MSTIAERASVLKAFLDRYGLVVRKDRNTPGNLGRTPELALLAMIDHMDRIKTGAK